MPSVSVLGVDVHYVGYGAADAARTVVLLHGFALDHRMCVAAFEPCFAPRPGWRRLYLDFPGMGKTRAPDWIGSTDDVFRVTAAAIDALVPGRYALGGASYGGYIAAGLMAADPDRITGLALIVPVVLPREGRDLADRRVLMREPGLDVPEVVEETAVLITAEAVRRTREEIEAPRAEADEAVVDRIDGQYAGSFPLLPARGPYDGPALVIVGRQDDVLGYNDQWRIYGQWPRATFAVLDRGGHGLYIELAAVHDALVNDWIDRVEQEPVLG